MEGSGGREVSPKAKKLSAIDSFWEKESQFSLRVRSSIGQPNSSERHTYFQEYMDLLDLIKRTQSWVGREAEVNLRRI